MSNNAAFDGITFDLPKNQSNVIKVIGVGGGGSNAINHMFELGINGVDFIVCNTDAQALQNTTVPNKIQLGVSLTEGLGAGANPEVGEQAAIESFEDITKMLGTNTKMVFITAGMGGGTGTGAAPIIAKMAKELDILTVGIVTVPFQFEGKVRNQQAQAGVERLRGVVDSLIVINNNKLREVYGNLGFKAGFAKADEVLATAARGIAEVITHHYTQNIDLRDAKTVLSNSGTAIMGSASASGANRAQEAIFKALDSPLLNDNKIAGAKNVLLLIVSGKEEITLDEIGEINDHIQTEAGYSANIIMGVGEDDSLGDAVAVTVIATGFDSEQQDEIVNTEAKRIIHTLEEDQRATQVLSTEKVVSQKVELPKPVQQVVSKEASKVVPVVPSQPEPPKKEAIIRHTLIDEEPQQENDLVPTTDFIKDIDVVYEEVKAPVQTAVSTEDFVITDINDIEVVDPEFVIVEKEEQITLSFDMPEAQQDVVFEPVQQQEQKVVYELQDEEEIKQIEVKDHIEVVPVTEQNEAGVTRYSLDDYMEEEDKPVQQPATKVTEVEEEVVFETKTVNEPAVNHDGTVEDETDPFNSSIEDTLKKRADERRKKLKEFNYKFRHNMSKIDEIEKEPAYKRMGIDLEAQANEESSISRTTLGTDSNNDIQLRSNNSFLHDNVD